MGPARTSRASLPRGPLDHDGQKVFWDVHDGANAVVIKLHDDDYQRLVIEVDDPGAAVALIERAIGGQ